MYIILIYVETVSNLSIVLTWSSRRNLRCTRFDNMERTDTTPNMMFHIVNFIYLLGISIDWLGRNIFWADSSAKAINVASINGHYIKTLFDQNIGRPRAVITNPIKG